MAAPTNSEIMAELQALRRIIEKHLPGAVSSEATRQEERERQVWGLELARKSRLKASGK